ncbi:MAG TPA: arsenate reductase (thioredoxin) [Atopostipes sp.]|nr:arsenate reductase (thioredoxin) [Atopostipes sp.]
MSRKTVYIFSEDNSSSLQMVEGFIRKYLNIDKWNVQTGARQKNLLNPLAVEVMHEIGIDIRNQSSNLVDLSFVSQADYIINLSGDIQSNFKDLAKNVRVESWSFEEPEKAQGTKEEKLIFFRRVRNAIKNRVQEFAEVEG